MNDPIINPWLFYWLDVINSINVLLVVLSVIGTAGTLGSLFVYWEKVDRYRSAYDDYSKSSRLEEKILAGKTLKLVGGCTAVVLLLTIFTPTRPTILKMMIAKEVTQANIKAAGDTIDQLLDKVVTRIIDGTKNKK